MFNNAGLFATDDAGSFESDDYLRSLVALREIAKTVYGEMRKTEWKQAIKSKTLQRKLVQMCNLIGPYKQPALLQKMIVTKDPWLYLVGAAFVGLDIDSQLNRFDNIANGMGEEDEEFDRENFLAGLDALIKSPELDKLRDNARRKTGLVAKSLSEYIKNLTIIYRKLMIIRLDLWYGKTYTTDMQPQSRILNDWQSLLAYIEVKFSSSYIGYAIKLEFGEDKGIHMHTLLFFNGDVVRTDTMVALRIGEHWKYVVTEKAGGYFNCNKSEYKRRMELKQQCCIGVFSGVDRNFLAGLRVVTNYFAERDPVVRLAIPELDRTLRRSSLSQKEKGTLARKLAKETSPGMIV